MRPTSQEKLRREIGGSHRAHTPRPVAQMSRTDWNRGHPPTMWVLGTGVVIRGGK
jgi:hypothetical protein